MKKLILFCLPLLLAAPVLSAQLQPIAKSNPASVTILSSNSLNGIAGDFVTVKAQIRNTGDKSLSGIITYLSMVDNDNKLPVDLEDWSAEKGVVIKAIKSGETLPLIWKIHFVKAGQYTLLIVATDSNAENPQVSSAVHFHVKDKINLNPGKVLPVAIGMPLVLLIIMLIINYRRRRVLFVAES